MRESAATLVSKTKKVIPDLLDATSLDVFKEGKLYHLKNCRELLITSRRPGTYMTATTTKPSTPMTIKLSELRPTLTCEDCFRAFYSPKVLPHTSFLNSLYQFIIATSKARNVLNASSTTPLGISRSLRNIESAEEKFEVAYQAFLAKDILTQEDEARIRALISEVSSYKAGASKSLVSPQEQEAALKEVKEFFFKDVPPDYLFDDTPTLVGISPYHEDEWTRLAHTLTLQFRVPAPHLVLLLPLYAAEFLSKIDSRSVKRFMHPIVVAQGVDEETIDTAAKLWDPLGSGPLVSLLAALRAAQALQA